MKRITVVEPVMIIMAAVLMTYVPVNVQLMYKKVCLQKFNATYCDLMDQSSNTSYVQSQNEVQEETAAWSVYSSLALSLPSLIPSLFFGAWSDMFGRLPLLRLSILGELLRGIGLFFSSYFMSSSIWWNIFVFAVTSFFGGFTSIIASCFSYVTDVTTGKARTTRVIVLQSIFFCGYTSGSLLSGLVLKYYSFVPTFGMMISLSFAGLMYTFILKETNCPEVKHPAKDALSVTHLKKSIVVVARKREGNSRMALLLQLVALFFIAVLLIGHTTTIVLFAKHAPRNMSSVEIGYYLAENGIVQCIGALVLVAVLTRVFKWTDYPITLLAVFCYFGLFISTAVSETTLQLYLSSIFMIGTGLALPAIRAVMSKTVAEDERGKLFAFTAVFESLSVLVTGMGLNKLYEKTVAISPNFSFYVLAGVCLPPVIVLCFLLFRHRIADEAYSSFHAENEINTDIKDVAS